MRSDLFVCCVVLLSVLATSAPSSAEFITVYGGPTYTPGVGGISGAQALDVNDAGTVVVNGQKFDPSGVSLGYRAFFWNTLTVTELEVLGTTTGGYTNSFAKSMNSSGVVVGLVDKYGGSGASLPLHAVRWDTSGAVTELGALGRSKFDNSYGAEPVDVNDAGTAIGASAKFDSSGTWKGSRTVRWDASDTAAIELGNLGTNTHGITASRAVAINNAGIAIGWAHKYDDSGELVAVPPVRWDASGAAIELEGGRGSEVFAINNAGTAVGHSPTFIDDEGQVYGWRPVRWEASGTAATALATGTHFSEGVALKIFDSGVVVGQISAPGEFAHIAVWDASGALIELEHTVADINDGGIAVGAGLSGAVYSRLDGSVVDLNSLIDPDSGWTLNYATAISNTGWITGGGTFDPDGPGGQAAYDRLFLMHVPATVGLSGDYNQDGVVDAADYVVWRKGLGMTYTQEHFNAWLANFGASLASASGSTLPSAEPLSASVPEPAPLVVLLLTSAGISLGRRTRALPVSKLVRA